MLLPLLGLAACDGVSFGSTDTAVTRGSDADADSDADSDADADADSDSDADADGCNSAEDGHLDCASVPEDFCARSFSTAPPAGPECRTAALACGDEVDATTEGGSSVFDGDDYDSNWFCTPNLDRDPYDGPERVYEFLLNADTSVSFVLQSPCSDLDMMVAYWQDTETCPVENSILECESADGTSTFEAVENLWSDGGGYYLVVIESKDGSADDFRLTVNCGQ